MRAARFVALGLMASVAFGTTFSAAQNQSPLTAQQIQAVIAQHQSDLKRDCWENAKTTTPNVSEKLSLTIAADGRVTSASASGNDAAVGTCIETSARTWMFPASSGPTTVSIPFHFVK